jgi:uncharacterized protein YegJ (DUF2314 family)
MDRAHRVGEPVTMRRLLRAALPLLALWIGSPSNAQSPDRIITLRQGDAEMAIAQAKARASLPEFWKKFAAPAPGEDRFMLKVMMPYSAKNVEHIWVGELERKDGMIRGTVGNTPKNVTYVKFGQRAEFDETQISDWMYRRNGKIVGNFTMRPLLARMPPDEAAHYRAMLAEP